MASVRSYVHARLQWFTTYLWWASSATVCAQPARFAVSSTLGLQQALAPVPAAPAIGYPSSLSQEQRFLAGGCMGSVLRAEAIPNRTFYAADEYTVQDPFDTMRDAGLNALRIETYWNTCSTSTVAFNNSRNVLDREMHSLLDAGCIDIAVMTAALGKERNMTIVLTINTGTEIPTQWQSYNYTQMLSAIDKEVRRQLTPFV